MSENVFVDNCRRAEYNAEYDNLQQLVIDYTITPEEFYSKLRVLKEKYQDVLNTGLQED